MKLREILSDRETWQGLAIILGLSVFLAVITQLGLIRRFWQGEFKQAFINRQEFPGLVFVSLAEAESLWASGEALLVDSRSREEYAAGHVPGAFSLPLVEIKSGQEDLLRLLPEDKPLVVYCEGGSCQTSLALAKILFSKGFKNIKVFSGGWEEWLQAGLPVEK